jgi:6-phosphogluconolactonase (cycloisomerase 2 family)
LTLVNTAVTGNYPEFLAVDPSAKFVYVTSTADNVISEYTISANGTLTSVGSISAGGQNAYGLAISPKKFVYSSTGLPPMITEFSINASTGALSVAGTFSGGTNFDIPAKLTFDPSGSNAYMYNAAGIAQFTVDTSTGALNLTGTEVTTAGPIVIDPSGKFAFGFTDYDTVGQFSIGSHGTLTPNGSIALDPNFDAQSLVIGQ